LYYNRKMLKYDLQALNSRYDVRIKYNKNLKAYELFLYFRRFAIARDIQELYQIISSLNQFRLKEKNIGKCKINDEPLELYSEKEFLQEFS